MKKNNYILTLVAAFATLFMALDHMTPLDLIAIGFVLWSISPYAYLALLINAAKTKAAIIAILILGVIVCSFSLYLIYDIMYVNLDAQSGLIFIFAPFYQWFGMLILTGVVVILNLVGEIRD